MADKGHDHDHGPGERAAVGKGHDITNKLFGIESAWNLFERVRDAIGAFLSQFLGGVTVQVTGGPQADIRRIWYLTLAAAFGRLRNGVTSSYANISYAAEWDITGKACRVEIVYNLSKYLDKWGENVVAFDIRAPDIKDNPLARFGMLAAGRARLATGLLAPGSTPWTYIKRGPEQLTIGGPLPDWMQKESGAKGFLVRRAEGGGRLVFLEDNDPIPEWVGIKCEPATVAAPRVVTGSGHKWGGVDVLREWPIGSTGLFGRFPYWLAGTRGATGLPVRFRDVWSRVGLSGALRLPDDGRVITTGEKNDPTVQPPQPHIDGRARTSLLHLVSQALLDPCYLPPTLPCTAVPSPPGFGKQVYAPGEDNNKFESILELSKRVGAVRSNGTTTDDPVGPAASANPDGLPVLPITTANFKGS